MTIRITHFKLENGMALNAREIVGKKVFSSDGSEIGKVKDILLDAEKLNITSIVVGQGLFKSDMEIGRNYIDRLDPEGIFLNIRPAEELKNRDVYDDKGKHIGRVKDVRRIGPTNELHGIIVDVGLGMPDVEVSEENIKEFGEHIIIFDEGSQA